MIVQINLMRILKEDIMDKSQGQQDMQQTGHLILGKLISLIRFSML